MQKRKGARSSAVMLPEVQCCGLQEKASGEVQTCWWAEARQLQQQVQARRHVQQPCDANLVVLATD